MDDSNKKIQIYVVSHSEHDIKDIEANDIYVPLFVGRAGKDNLGFLSDDTGDNISDKNSSYCELTGLYWIWKNSTADVIGLAHYRRYFAKWKFGKRLERKDIEEILKDYDIISLRFQLKLEGHGLLGSSFLDKSFAVKSGEKFDLYFELCTDNFIPGKYLADVVVFASDGAGNARAADAIPNGLSFEISNEFVSDYVWWRDPFGFVKFDDMKLIRK